MTPEALKEIIALHSKWRRGEPGGARANLTGADLTRAYLADADLADANLADAIGLPSATTNSDPATPEPKPWRRLTPEERKAAQAERALRYRTLHPEVPVVEHLDAKILEAISAGASLDMSTWHTCETTHCRAGFAVHLAGAAGYELEKQLGSQRAGAAIYRASTGRVPHFFANNEAALLDIRECAAEQEVK